MNTNYNGLMRCGQRLLSHFDKKIIILIDFIRFSEVGEKYVCYVPGKTVFNLIKNKMIFYCYDNAKLNIIITHYM